MCLNSELNENVTLNRKKMIFNRKKKSNSESINENYFTQASDEIHTDWN